MRSAHAKGFTLIEMMVVVATIAVLTSLAVPATQKFKIKGYRAEAYLGLGTIGRLQGNFLERNSRYARTLDELGFTMDRGSALTTNSWKGNVYTFSITPLDANASAYQATATGNVDGDVFQDILVIVRN